MQPGIALYIVLVRGSKRKRSLRRQTGYETSTHSKKTNRRKLKRVARSTARKTQRAHPLFSDDSHGEKEQEVDEVKQNSNVTTNAFAALMPTLWLSLGPNSKEQDESE